MTIRLTLDPRARKDNTHTILIKIVDGREYRKKISTPLKIEKRFWDIQKERVKSTYDNSRILNRELDELQVKIRTALDKYSAKQFTRKQVESYVSGKTDFDTVDGYIETVINRSRSKPTYIDYRTAINSLKTHTGYSKERPLLFHEVNFKLLSDFKLKSKEVGMSPSSFNSYLTKIRAIMNDAFDKGYIFDKFTLDRRLRRPVKRKPIQTATPDQILKGIEKVKTIYDWQSVGFWVLMFATRGTYPADVVNFTSANIRLPKFSDWMEDHRSYLVHTRSKTSESANEDLIIRIDDDLLPFIDALKRSLIFTHYPKKPNIIPSLEDRLKLFNYDPTKEYVLHTNTWDYYKKRIKKLTGLSYNKARKTFNTIALELAVPDTIRRVLLGHADSTMLSFYDNTKTKSIQNQVEQAHREVLSAFRIREIIDVLFDKTDAINAPDWVWYNSPFKMVEEWKKKQTK